MRNCKVLFGGTLGDAFLDLCRLARVHEIYNVVFTAVRASAFEYRYFDKPISELFSLTPYVNFLGASIESVDEQVYLNYIINGVPDLSKSFDIVSCTNDNMKKLFPRYSSPQCFPNITTPTVSCENKYCIIQVQGGKYKKVEAVEGKTAVHGDLRGFLERGVATMCRYLNNLGYFVYLMGVSTPVHRASYYDGLEDSFDVKNLMDNTNLVEAMGYIKNAEFFIGFDGFLSFFAPSQRVPTLLLSHLPCNPRFEIVGDNKDGCLTWKDYVEFVRPLPFPYYSLDVKEEIFDRTFTKFANRMGI